MDSNSSNQILYDRSSSLTLEDEDATGTDDADSLAEKVIDRAWTVFDNQSVADDKELSSIAERIGNNWEKLGLDLGLSNVQIDRIKLDNPTTAMQIYKMLLIWRDISEDEATVENLLSKIQCAPASVNIDWKALGDIYPSIRPVQHQLPVQTSVGMEGITQQSPHQSSVQTPISMQSITQQSQQIQPQAVMMPPIGPYPNYSYFQGSNMPATPSQEETEKVAYNKLKSNSVTLLLEECEESDGKRYSLVTFIPRELCPHQLHSVSK